MAADLHHIAEEIGKSLAHGDGERARAEALRLAFSFVEVFDHAGADRWWELVRERPEPVGDERLDALLAALAEHLCAGVGLRAPLWVEAPERFLSTWWFVSGITSLHADALVHSPISFSRRGVFVTSGALSYA